MSGHTLRIEFLREFKDLRANPRWLAIVIVASYVLQLVVAICLGYWILQSQLTLPTGIALVMLIFFIGTRLRGLNNIVHECSHHSFSDHRDDNVVLGSFCASMIFGCFATYRDEHMTHHAHVGDYERDKDLSGIRDFRFEDPLTPGRVLKFALMPLVGLHLPYYLGFNLSGRDGEAFRVMKLGLIALGIVLLVLDPVPALLMVWLPYLWVFPAINFWTDCVDHAGLVGSKDELESSRNFLLPLRLKVILFPRNDCYHLVHHLFPQVPAHHLEACHKRLLANPEYREHA
jgi:fatty acid desaturase